MPGPKGKDSGVGVANSDLSDVWAYVVHDHVLPSYLAAPSNDTHTDMTRPFNARAIVLLLRRIPTVQYYEYVSIVEG